MSQTVMQDPSYLSQQEAQKQQKKQVKREAKLRLKVERARWDARKAEMRVAQARLEHEIANTRLRAFEEELTKMSESNQDTNR